MFEGVNEADAAHIQALLEQLPDEVCEAVTAAYLRSNLETEGVLSANGRLVAGYMAMVLAAYSARLE